MRSGTLQKSYVFPCLNLTFIRRETGSYPTALIASEFTRIISTILTSLYIKDAA